MTDSRPDKRSRLVAGAADLLHQRGYRATTLAEVAKVADVPPGNVYYYFKTKSDLVRAVADATTTQVDAMLAAADARPTPRDRLKAVARRWAMMRDVIAEHGCPIGTLALELNRSEGEVTDGGAALRRVLDWAEAQMRQLGTASPRRDAVAFLAGIQGGAVLAAALHDAELMSGQVHHLEQWIDGLG
jgi:AcrR family transcriptional regulator